MFDVQRVRADFPILSRKVNELPLVYLDNAATSHKPQAVIDAIVEYYSQHNANVHRGVHTLGDESTQHYHESRAQIATFFGAKSAELVVVRNTTEAVNLVASTWASQHVSSGDIILSSELEHHSNLSPWQRVAKRVGAELKLLEVNDQGVFKLSELENHLASGKVKLLCLAHVSNTLGTLLPLSEVLSLAKKYQVKTFIDGAQAASHIPVHFDEWGVDFYAISAHKMLGPMGIGGVLIKESILSELEPWLLGGGMINEVTAQDTTYSDDLEDRFTAGTPDVAGLVGWAAATRYLSQFSWSELRAHDEELQIATRDILNEFLQIKIVGPEIGQQLRVGSVTFIYEGVHPHDVGQILDSVGVAVRSGQHCTMPLHTKFGWLATIRASFQLYTSVAELAALRKGLQKVQKVFGK